MLRVTGDLVSLVQKALATNSMDNLAVKLAYLQNWGEGAKDTVRVNMLCCDGEADLSFLNKDGSCMMYGGLVYHISSNIWGVHT